MREPSRDLTMALTWVIDVLGSGFPQGAGALSFILPGEGGIMFPLW